MARVGAGAAGSADADDGGDFVGGGAGQGELDGERGKNREVFPAGGGLLLVATPIGNLGDVTHRAAAALAEADLVLAEDTRRAGILLRHLGLRKVVWSFHEHNERSRVAEVMGRLAGGAKVALLSDAGMPCLSDPGFVLVRECVGRGVAVSALPGPSAITAALAVSGLPPVPFYFGGFLPVKSGRRGTELELAVGRGITHVYFESPHRLVNTLAELSALGPEMGVCVVRELSKLHEEIVRGTASEVLARFEGRRPRGEITLVFSAGVRTGKG